MAILAQTLPPPTNAGEFLLFIFLFVIPFGAALYFLYVWPIITAWRKGKTGLALMGILIGLGTFDGIDEAAAERLDEAVSEAAVPVLCPFGEVAELG